MNVSTSVQASRATSASRVAGAGFKTLIVQVEPPPAGAARLTAVMALAKRLGAAVVGVGGGRVALYTDPSFVLVDGETIQLLTDQLNEDIASARQAFETAADAAGVEHAWRAEIDFPEKVMARHVRSADLVIVSNLRTGLRGGLADPGDILMTGGLPVLALPDGAEVAPEVRTALIAWKNTRETRRAISDALPFLVAAERVMVVGIPERVGQDLEPELADVAERLRRHGVTADTEASPHLDVPVGEQLLGIADSRDVDLIVAGGYGHSRLREWALGGVTEHLLTRARRPVLFSR